MPQIRQGGVVSDEGQIGRLQEDFARVPCVVLPQLIARPLLDLLLARLSTRRLETKAETSEGGVEFGRVMFLPRNDPLLYFFTFILNSPALFRVIERITGCPPIGNFVGRIHRSHPGASHHIDWHGDNYDSRLVGITVNLSTEEYSGGAFQLRRRGSQDMLCEVTRAGLGDAFVFSISPELEHRLAPVDAGGCRTAGVGWFRAQPNWPTFARDFFLP